MYLIARCKKCNEYGPVDIGSLEIEEVKKRLKQIDFGHCSFSFHVEIGKMSDYLEIDYSKIYETKNEVMEGVKQCMQNQ